MKSKKVTVGVDFDGVLAYNPFRVIRSPVTYIKRNVFKNKRTNFYIPKTDVEKLIWGILHESSIFPAQGVGLLKERVESGQIEAHLVSARYSFLQKNLYAWLERHKLTDMFKTITINQNDEQPHIYKARVIEEKGFDYFIEDNYDIVEHVVKKRLPTKTLWIYNILDRGVSYEYKYPYLESAVRSIFP